MSYLKNFLGVECWKCKQGRVELLDKIDGVYLACSGYPNSCQFISASPIQCPNCSEGYLFTRFEENILYLIHEACSFKSAVQAFDNEASQLKATGVLIDYLITLSFDELNELWDSEAWATPENLPISESLDESTVKEIIQKIRSVKWRLLSKKP